MHHLSDCTHTQMALRFFKKFTNLNSIKKSHFQLRFFSSSTNSGIYNLSPLISDGRKNEFDIELVDSDTWHVSSGLAEAWRGNNNNYNNNLSVKSVLERKGFSKEDEDFEGGNDLVNHYVPPNKEDPDFDEIEDMRIRGNLFYKMDKHSKEYEDHTFDFHRRNTSNKKKNARSTLAYYSVEKEVKNKDEQKEDKFSLMDKRSHLMSQLHKLENKKKKENSSFIHSGEENKMLSLTHENSHVLSRLYGMEGYNGKIKRTPTFNQLTAPYHEPFCLDIYVSKGSVRASVIHRATSKVVATAHSISKDLKFDLGSTKSRNACALVGKVLAQRALDDDIYNMVYTPRKGEKLEGKLQIVLKAIIDGGVFVKVKLKQRKAKKVGMLTPYGQEKH